MQGDGFPPFECRQGDKLGTNHCAFLSQVSSNTAEPKKAAYRKHNPCTCFHMVVHGIGSLQRLCDVPLVGLAFLHGLEGLHKGE